MEEGHVTQGKVGLTSCARLLGEGATAEVSSAAVVLPDGAAVSCSWPSILSFEQGCLGGLGGGPGRSSGAGSA